VDSEGSVPCGPRCIPTVSQINPVYTIPSYFFDSNFNIIFPSTPSSSKQFISYRFLYENPIRTTPLAPTCLGRLILCDLITRMIFDEEYISRSSSLAIFSHSVIPPLLRHNIFLIIYCWTLQPLFFTQYKRPVYFHVKQQANL